MNCGIFNSNLYNIIIYERKKKLCTYNKSFLENPTNINQLNLKTYKFGKSCIRQYIFKIIYFLKIVLIKTNEISMQLQD